MKAISFASQFRRDLVLVKIHLFTRRDRSAFICLNLHASNLVTFFGPVPAPNLYVLLGRTVVRKSLQRPPVMSTVRKTRRLGLSAAAQRL
jgi:hypothetical protein